MRLPRLFLPLPQTSPMRSLSRTIVRQDPSGKLPASCKRLELRVLKSSTLFLTPLLELGPCQSAVLLGSPERRTGGNWHPT